MLPAPPSTLIKEAYAHLPWRPSRACAAPSPQSQGPLCPTGSKGTCPVPQLQVQFWQEPNATQGPAEAWQHSHPSHLVLLPELAQDVAVDGILHKADVKALDAEVEIPKPEHKAVGGREGDEMEGQRLPESGSTAGGKTSSACGQPQPAVQVLSGAPVKVSMQPTAWPAASPARIPQVGPSTINQTGLTFLGRN